MNRLLLALVLFAAIVATLLWWLLPSPAPATPVPLPSGAAPATTPAPTPPAAVPAPAGAPATVPDTPVAPAGPPQITGTVVDPQGAPLAGATVTGTPRAPMTRVPQGWYEEHRRAIETDAEGHFALSGLPEGEVTVQAKLAGYCGSSDSFHKTSTGAPPLTFVLEPCCGVTGRVFAPDGTPLAEAKVRIDRVEPAGGDRERWSGYDRRATTAADGTYELASLPPGHVDLVAIHERYTSEAAGVDLAIGDRLEGIDFTLAEGLSIAGRVVDERETGIESAELELRGSSSASSRPQSDLRHATTDAEGHFEIRGLDPGKCMLEATHADHHGAMNAGSGWLEIDAGTLDLKIVLVRGGTVSGRVVDEAGAEVAEAHVSAGPGLAGVSEDARSGVYRGLKMYGRSEADGSFVLRGVPPGAIGVAAASAGFTDSEVLQVELDLSKPLEGLVLVLGSGATLSGVVVDQAGAPLAGAKVLLAQVPGPRSYGERLEEAGTSDADGGFAIHGLAAERQYHLGARLAGYATSPEALRTPHAGSESGVRLQMVAGAIVRGTVKDGDGQLIGNVNVEARRAYSGLGAADEDTRNVNASDGSFEVQDLRAGSWTFSARREGSVTASTDVQLAAGEVKEGVELVLAAGGQVSGRVVDEDGNPLPGVDVSCQMDGSPRQFPASATSAADGQFSFQGVPPGRVRLSVHVFRGEFVSPPPVSAAPGDHVTIVMKRGLTITGTVVDDAAQPLPQFEVRLQTAETAPRAAKLDHFATTDGRFALFGCPASGVRLEVRAAGFGTTWVETPGLPATGEHDVGTIVMQPGVKVSGQVLGTGGAGVPGAKLALVQPGSGTDPYEGRGLPEATSDVDGAFTLVGAPAASLELLATHSGHRPARVPLSIEAGHDLDGVIVRLSAGASIVGTVRGADGPPHAGFGVGGYNSSVPAGPGGGYSWNVQATTDAEGRFELSGLEPGVYELWFRIGNPIALGGGATTTDSLRRSVRVGDGETVRLDLQLDAGCHVTGRVRGGAADASSPRIGLSSDVASWNATLDASGNFDFPGVAPGTYTASVPGLLRTEVVIPDAPEHTLELDAPAASISGRVVDAGGAPVAGASVTIAELGGNRTKTEADGAFALAHLEAGTYVLLASQQGIGQVESEPLEVTEGNSITGVELILASGHTLLVHVLDPAGQPVSVAQLGCAQGTSGRMVPVDVAPGGEPGSYALQGVPPGTCRIFAGTSELGTSWGDCRGGADTELTVSLSTGAAALQVTVLAGGEPVRGSYATLLAQGGVVADASGPYFVNGISTTSTAGLATWGKLPPGSYQLRLSPRDGESTNHEVQVAPGPEPTRITIEVE